MTVKEYLRQYHRATETLRQLDAEVAALEAEIDSTSANADSGHGSDISNRTERMALRLIDMKQRWLEAREQAWAVREEVENVILMAPDPVYGRLLYDRYILFMGWGEITDDLRYSDESHVRGRLHSKALQSVAAYVKEEE